MTTQQLPSSRILKVADATAAGTTTINSSVVDTAGYEGVIFFTNIATAAANNGLQAQQGLQSNLSDAANLAGSLVSSNPSEEVTILEIVKPLKRYVRASVVRGTSTAVGEIYAILCNPRTLPQSSVLSGTAAAKSIVSPAEGTP